STDLDLKQFYGQMSSDPVWKPLLRQLHGLRPIQDPDPFESMIRTIIGQQLNTKFAATLVERLINLGAEQVPWRQDALPVFPSPERIAALTYEDLRSRSFSQRKAEYVIDFARAVVDGRIDLDTLWTAPDEAVFAALTPLRGIGRWTVECFLLSGLGRPDLLPAADIGIQNAVQRLYGLADRPNESAIRQLAEPWAPWRSYATYYLWQSLIATGITNS
ncbi:MAG: DNA-3-methyladenine glycosylase, partial [Alicyclobacillus sp.]|nr:DNA-3-methyladenine glycosylase [Alicyclobacillus sp.]